MHAAEGGYPQQKLQEALTYGTFFPLAALVHFRLMALPPWPPQQGRPILRAWTGCSIGPPIICWYFPACRAWLGAAFVRTPRSFSVQVDYLAHSNLFIALTEPFLKPIRNFLPTPAASIFRRSFCSWRSCSSNGSSRTTSRLSSTDPDARQPLVHQRRPLLRGFPDRRDDPSRDPAHGHRWRRSPSIRRCTARVSRCSASRRFAGRSAIPSPIDDILVFHIVLRQDRAGRLAQRRRQSRLRRLPVSRSRSIRATRCRRSRKSSASRRTPTGRPASSMCARAGSTSTARPCSNTPAG